MNWRRNVASLSKTELLRFTTAVNALKNNGAQGNKYDEFVLWHHAAANKDTPENQVTPPKVPTRAVAHTGPSFFPWHRYFIRRFELELQKVVNGTGITLPYWNWTEDSSSNIPANMAVWNKDCMGGTGDDTDYFVVKTGPFQGWPIVRTEVGPLQQWESPDNKLTRNLTGSGYPLPTSAEVSNALKDITSYDTSPWNNDSEKSFRKALEEVHGRIHLWVGGSMFPMTSPNDPVFFLHHCYVDRIWDRWQINKPDNDDYYPSDGTVTTGGGVIPYQNRSAKIFPWDEERNPPTLSSVLSSQQIEVAYDPGNHAITTVPTGSGNLEVYWIGSNGSVNCRWYDHKQNWRDPYRIAVPGSASVPSGSITAIYDHGQRHVWWTRPDSSVGHWVGGYDQNGIWSENTVPSTVKYISTSGGIAALFIRNAPQMFCIGCDSQVYREYWDGSNWRSEALRPMRWCSISSGLAAVPNGPTAVDVLWIEGDGSVKGQWFHDGGAFDSNDYGIPYEIAGPGSAWGNSIVAVSSVLGGINKIDVWWIGPTDSGQRAARPNAQNGYVYWNSSADRQWKGARAINTGGSIRGGMAAVVSSPTSMEVYWIYNGGRYGMTWNSSEGWGGTYTLYGSPASTSGGLAASMRTSNEIDVLWVGPDNSVVGTNINYQRGQWPQGNQTRFDALPDVTPFPGYAASTGLPSDGGV